MSHIEDTEKHIYRVQELAEDVASAIMTDTEFHDQSKLEEPERSIYEEVVPQFVGLEYGSDEYKAVAKKLGPAWDHHKAHNRHHVEYFDNHVEGMNLIDIIEMLCDWKAAGERGGNSIAKSFAVQRARWCAHCSPDTEHVVFSLLENTAIRLGWTTREEIDDASSDV
jgi:hypothetical protein